ncbi:MAG: GYD domain-containing protein [Planctomycetota bacterium]
MATYIVLLDFTDQGIRNLEDSPQRADAFNAFAEKAGVKIVGQYWTIGSHDGVLLIDAPDEERAASVLLHLGMSGNVRTTTLRAYDWAQAQELIASEG